ncbi:MAG: pyridoxal phosphate-dependent aminotransferase [Muribaculaceae bacterium]|nr:pyridoxal phosphate-dependent aminotransferase [Muribaculaceae bacterium]
MKYDFDAPVVRRGTGCYKWDCDEMAADVIPMWVADMDFRVAQPIIDALHRRVEHGVFGYEKVPDAYYDAVIDWFSRRHGWKIEREWIQYTTGVVPASSAVIKALTGNGDKVLVQTPVYNCFFSSIKNNGCEVLRAPLRFTGWTYEVDFSEFERIIRDERPRLFLMCSPHNPAGRVWKREELLRMGEICLRYGVMVVSDEIHCELLMPGQEFTPFASLSAEMQSNCITLNSPSKSFNIAGLQCANIICSNSEIRAKIDRALNDNEVCDINPLGVEAVIAAYNESEDWIDRLNEYLWSNYQCLRRFFAQNMPQLKVCDLEGTYLVWVNISATGLSADELTHRLLSKGRVLVNSGMMYSDGASEGRDFIRLNIACPRSQMMEGLERISRVLRQI